MERGGRAVEAPPGVPEAWRGREPSVRDLPGLPTLLGGAGPLELRLAASAKEVRKAQRLRFKVFYEQGSALADPAAAAARRDACPYDGNCDHLLVVDTAYPDGRGGTRRKVVGTTRLLRGEVAARCGGFYSATEFALDPLLGRHPDKRFLEMGRSCVHADYRGRRVIELLWHGIGLYAAHHGIDVLIGCSSLPGTAVEALAVPLSFAHHYAAAAPEWQVEALPQVAVRMDRLAREAVEPRAAMALLPPLVKAYMRAGCTFASRAAVDHQFGTTDLFTVLPLASANPRYVAHFGRGLARAA